MASVFRHKYNKTIDGRKVKKESRCWYVKYKDADGIERRVKGYPDKEATRQMAARLEKEAALANEGVVDRYKDHRLRPLPEHLEDFRQCLLAKGNTTKHAELTYSRARTVVEGCRFTTWGDIFPAARCNSSLWGYRTMVKAYRHRRATSIWRPPSSSANGWSRTSACPSPRCSI